MTTYTVHMDNVQAVAEEMGALGSKVQAMIEQLNQDCAASLAEWTSTAREAYQTYSGQWTTAANDLPVQAANAQNSLGEITNAYATAEYQGLGLWGQ
jgi:WXG100 family type VII secretion target